MFKIYWLSVIVSYVADFHIAALIVTRTCRENNIYLLNASNLKTLAEYFLKIWIIFYIFFLYFDVIYNEIKRKISLFYMK